MSQIQLCTCYINKQMSRLFPESCHHLKVLKSVGLKGGGKAAISTGQMASPNLPQVYFVFSVIYKSGQFIGNK